MRDARLGRHHELAARALLPAADPAAARARARGRGDRARVRADARAARAARDRSTTSSGRARRRRRAREGARDELGRLPALRRFAKPRRFDLALAHGSHELTLAHGASASRARPPTTTSSPRSSTNSAAGRQRESSSPTRSPPSASHGYGAKPPKLRRYPGIKEEYYLADFEPTRRARRRIAARCSPSCGRRRRSRSTTGTATRSSSACSTGSGATSPCTPSYCRARRAARAIRALGLPSLHVPEHAVDAQSLIALADLVVSAGGTMNREAVALGTPVYTTFTGRLGDCLPGKISPAGARSTSRVTLTCCCGSRTRGRSSKRGLVSSLLLVPKATTSVSEKSGQALNPIPTYKLQDIIFFS